MYGIARTVSHLLLLCAMLTPCAIEGQEQVKMTLLSRNHFQSEVPSQYECHLSKQDEDAEVTSSRTSYTRGYHDGSRDSADFNPTPPDPRSHEDHTVDPVAYYVVDLSFDDDNDAFGVFACDATKDGRKNTSISTTRMRSNARIVPADDLFTKTVNINETNVNISVRFHDVSDANMKEHLRWRNNSLFRIGDDGSGESKYFGIDAFPIEGPVHLYHRGVYECHIAGERNNAIHALIILIVRACPANMWGTPTCEGVCDSCYNGGICDEGTGRCVCPPGFMGRYCLTACGGNRYGHVCEKKCSGDDQPDRCSDILFCLPHPFGCRCNTGWKGLGCNTPCDVNTYGANCLQSCHCASGRCNRYTGVCEGTDTSCEPGWTGHNCQECAGNRFGLTCMEECHCLKDSCNRETGLCTGACLPQWIEEPSSPYSCQTGLLNTNIIRGVNPNVNASFCCTAKKDINTSLDNLVLLLSREEKKLNNTGISKQEVPLSDGQIGEQHETFEVQTGEEGGVFYCQLWMDDALMAVLNISYVHKLPVLSEAPEWLISVSTNTSVTIRWRAWVPDRDDGDAPVVAYIPYYKRNSTDEWVNGSSVQSTGTLEFTASDLEEDTVYTFSVSVVREGEGGEGPFSPLLLAKTSPLCQVQNEILLGWKDCLILMKMQRDSELSSLIVVISSAVLGLIFIIVVGLVCYKRRKTKVPLLRKYSSHRSAASEPHSCSRELSSPCMQQRMELNPTAHQNGTSKLINSYFEKKATSMLESCEDYDAVVQPTTVPISQFYKYDLESLEEEYQLLPQGKIHPWTVGMLEQNKPKNRFKDMYTYDHSRVILEKLTDEQSDYYNASFILNQHGVKAFIAAQGPNSYSCNDFWRMIWEQKVSTVVMVTNLFKGNKERCKKYWPNDEGGRCCFGSVEVLWTETSRCADYIIRTFKVSKKGSGCRVIQQYHFLSWPDSDTPDVRTPFIEFVKRTRSTTNDGSVPVLVHCSAGIGKTGVFIALSCLMEVLQTEAYIDVFNFVEKMRQNRINMVQSFKEYQFLYYCLLEFQQTYHTEISAHYLATEYPHDQFIVFQKEFELLRAFMDEKVALKMYEGLKPENSGRNRFPCVVPCDHSIPALCSESQSQNPDDYINASVVDSFRKKDAFILTHHPLPGTIEDFWRMVYDWKCPLIVMLNQLDLKDESCVQYWPETGTLKHGYMSVTHIMAESKDYVIHRLFDISHKNDKETFSVHHLQLTDWPPEGSLQSIIETIEEVGKMQKEFGTTAPAVIQCLDGVSRSAVFVAVKSEMERLEETDKVNVFSTVKQLRENNINFLLSWDLYSLCYQLLYVKIHESSSTEAIY